MLKDNVSEDLKIGHSYWLFVSVRTTVTAHLDAEVSRKAAVLFAAQRVYAAPNIVALFVPKLNVLLMGVLPNTGSMMWLYNLSMPS
ncbi:hypothetical protein TNCV_4045791 [Trichonephila clavipes]|nr:hypothetical protein TNCV_4045791 [Trichonephila clavipes]